jgi:hypothetical protein
MPMEGKFQTSFIPKSNFGPTPLPKQRRPTNLFTLVSLIIFIVVIALAVAAFAYTLYLNNRVKTADTNLQNQLAQLNSSSINDISRTDSRIKGVESLLAGHIAPSGIFTFLANNTMQNVRFSNFSYTAGGSSGQNGGGSGAASAANTITMNGQAASFADVALQAQQFSSQASQQYITNPVFSNLGLDSSGNVTFSFTANIIPSAFTYSQQITGTSSPFQPAGSASSTPVSSPTGP